MAAPQNPPQEGEPRGHLEGVTNVVPDQHRRILENNVLRSAQVPENLLNLVEPRFSRHYRETRGPNDLAFVILVQGHSSESLECMTPALNPSVFESARQRVKDVIGEELVLMQNLRPERRTAYENFSQLLTQRQKARQLMSNALFSGLTHNDVMIYNFHYFNLLGQRYYDILDLFYRTSI